MCEKVLYQTVIMGSDSSDGLAGQFLLHYYLLTEQNENREEKTYGVFMEKEYQIGEKSEHELSTVALLTYSKEDAIKFLENIVRGKVTPLSFSDIISDYLSYC